jgi:hypothetical protein
MIMMIMKRTRKGRR